jgi:hypothetical protein
MRAKCVKAPPKGNSVFEGLMKPCQERASHQLDLIPAAA